MATGAAADDPVVVSSLHPAVTEVLSRQDGLANRRQLLSAGATESDVRSWLRGRRLIVVDAGVYAGHSGELTWQQRAGAATLRLSPAALHGVSAVRAALGHCRQVPESAPVHVAVAADRRVASTPTVEVHRTTCFSEVVHDRRFPPRVVLEVAALDAAVQVADAPLLGWDGPDELALMGLLAEVVGSRRTNAARLTAALAARPRLRHRQAIGSALADIADGACSVLERRYLVEVERAHGLPTAARQVRASARGTVFRDVLYAAYGVVVELDGRMDHTVLADRARDLERDLVAATDGLRTLRLGHGQVGPRACVTADLVARVLQHHGWTGRLRPCPRCPVAGDSADRRITVAERQ